MHDVTTSPRRHDVTPARHDHDVTTTSPRGHQHRLTSRHDVTPARHHDGTVTPSRRHRHDVERNSLTPRPIHAHSVDMEAAETPKTLTERLFAAKVQREAESTLADAIIALTADIRRK